MHLTVRDAATIFSVPEDRIYRWISDEELPSREVNGQRFFNQTELMEWATLHKVNFDPELIPQEKKEPAAGQGLVEALRAGGIVSGLNGADKVEVLRGC